MTEPASTPGGLRRFRIDLAYDGSDFSGWALQPGLRTVEGELNKALEVIFGELSSGLRVAGRTDAGVHALGQVVQMDLTLEQAKRVRPGLANKLNAILDRDIRVQKIQSAPEGFDARFSALSREYRYKISQSEIDNPLKNRYQLWHRNRLNVQLMSEAAKKLVGLHDFAAFCKPREGSTTIRELRRLEIGVLDDEIQIDLQADAFCHNQVRSIVGALIAVGEERISPNDLETILMSRKRVSKFKVVGPEGLTLMKVSYPEEAFLAEQAEKTRNMRTME